MFKYALLFSLSLLSSLVLTPLVRALAERLGIVDHPGEERRVHERATPRLGGVALCAALLSSLLAAVTTDRWLIDVFFGHGPELVAVGLGAMLVLLCGIIDDVRSLGPVVKLLFQAAAGLVAFWGGYRIETIAQIPLGIASLPVTLLWITAVTSAFNLMDGLDGLAAGIGVIVCATLFSTSIYTENVAAAMLLAALGGALLGFLRYNFYPATIFLGDSGSLLLGFLLAVVSIAPSPSNKPTALVAILVPLLALGLPLVETALTVLRRLLRGVEVVQPGSERYEFQFAGSIALLAADRRHIHHRLLDLGVTHRGAVLLLWGVCAVLGTVALAIVVVREPNEAFLLVAFGVAAVAGVRRLQYGEMRVLRNGVLLPVFDSPLVNRRILHVLLDLVFVVGALLLAYIVLGEGAPQSEVRRAFLDTVPLLALVQITSFVATGLYRSSYRYTGIADLFVALRGLGLALAAGWTATILLRIGDRPPFGVWVLDAYFLATFVIGARVLFHLLEHAFAAGHAGRRRVMIYGAGKLGLLALSEIQSNPALDFVAVGFLDDQGGKCGTVVRGCPVFGAEDFPGLLRLRKFDELIVATTKVPGERLPRVAEVCALAGIAVRRFSVGWEELAPAGESPPARIRCG